MAKKRLSRKYILDRVRQTRNKMLEHMGQSSSALSLNPIRYDDSSVWPNHFISTKLPRPHRDDL